MLNTNWGKAGAVASGILAAMFFAIPSVFATSSCIMPLLKQDESCLSSEDVGAQLFASDQKTTDVRTWEAFGVQSFTPTISTTENRQRQSLLLASAKTGSSATNVEQAEHLSVSIEKSLSVGLEMSNALAASRQAFISAKQTIGQATSGKDLTGDLAVSGSDIRTDAKPAPGGFVRDQSRLASIDLNKRIYDFGEADVKLRAAEFQIEKARASYQLTEQTVIFNIISAHLSVLTAQKAFDIRAANEQRLKAHTEAARIRLDAGSYTPTGLAEAEAQLARAQSDKIQAEADLQTAIEAYQSLTGLNSKGVRRFDSPASLPQTMTETENLAHIGHPSIIMATLDERIAELQFIILKRTVAPKLDFKLSASQTDRKGIQKDVTELTAWLQFATPFLVTEGTRSLARSNVANHTKARIDAAESRRLVGLEARRAFRNYQASIAQIQAVESELEAAKMVAEGTANEVEFGLKTFLDQLDAEQDLSGVELRHVQAQQALVLTGFGVLQATGQLNASRFSLSKFPPELDSLSEPHSRYPYILPIPVD